MRCQVKVISYRGDACIKISRMPPRVVVGGNEVVRIDFGEKRRKGNCDESARHLFIFVCIMYMLISSSGSALIFFLYYSVCCTPEIVFFTLSVPSMARTIMHKALFSLFFLLFLLFFALPLCKCDQAEALYIAQPVILLAQRSTNV